MDDIFDLILEAVYQIFSWMESLDYNGITVLQVSFFSLFVGLMWRFMLSPLFGMNGGSFSVGVSDHVSRKASNARRNSNKK